MELRLMRAAEVEPASMAGSSAYTTDNLVSAYQLHQGGLSALPAALSLGIAAHFVLAEVHWTRRSQLNW